MDVKHLATMGHVFTSDKDRNILSNIDVLSLVQSELKVLKVDDDIEQVVELLKTTNQKVFAVVDRHELLIGIVDFDHIKPVLFNAFRLKHTPLSELITQPAAEIKYDDGIQKIMKKFESSNAEVLPVTDKGKYLGFISKVAILESYRAKLKEMVIE